MSQLDRQYEELEEVGRNIEQCMRDAEGSELQSRSVGGGEGGGGEGREKGSKGEKSIEQCLRDTDGSEQWKS